MLNPKIENTKVLTLLIYELRTIATEILINPGCCNYSTLIWDLAITILVWIN